MTPFPLQQTISDDPFSPLTPFPLRAARTIQAEMIYHVLNLGNGRLRLFHKPEDYAGFERVLVEGLGRFRLTGRKNGDC